MILLFYQLTEGLIAPLTGFLWGSEDHFTEKTSCAIDFWKNTDPYTKNGSVLTFIGMTLLRYLIAMIELIHCFFISHCKLSTVQYKLLMNG